MVALRNETDDNLPQVFGKLGYEQDFRLIDIKLALGYLTVAIAGFLFYLEKRFAFKDTKLIIGGAIVVYAVICLVMYYLKSGAQYKNNKYIGKKDGKKVAVYTLTKSQFSPIYEIKVVFDDRLDGAVEVKIPFTKLFDSFGFLNEEELRNHVLQLLEKKTQ